MNVIIFIAQITSAAVTESMFFTETFGLTPSRALSGEVWQFVTYMFLHDPYNLYHIFINMFVFMIFGVPLEEALGTKKFLLLYFISGIGSALFFMGLSIGSFDSLLIGASGAVYAILTGYAFMYPNSRLIIFPIPYPIKAKYIVIGLIVISIALGITNVFEDNVAYFGHLGGIVIAVIMLYIWTKAKKRRPIEERAFEFFWE